MKKYEVSTILRKTSNTIRLIISGKCRLCYDKLNPHINFSKKYCWRCMEQFKNY